MLVGVNSPTNYLWSVIYMIERVHVDEKEIIRLFVEEHKSFNFIGKQLGISKGTVQRRLIANNIDLQISKICSICNVEFVPHNGMQEYCSKDCKDISKNNNRNKYTREELSNQPNRNCLVCNTEFEVTSRMITKKYCCSDCQNKAERLFGDKRQTDLDYKDKIRFGNNKYKVLERDNYKCQTCGNKSQLVVHHKDLSGQSDNVNNDMDNLVTLCRRCHINIHKY